jgi:UDP-N-acetylglucosamine 2-epimerase
MLILISYGTRPEILKCLPLIKAFDKNNIKYKTLFIGQHQDLVKSGSDYSIDILDGLNRLDSIIRSVMNTIPLIQKVEENKITHVLVQGDTTSAMAAAMSAFNNGLKVIHLEAGLRTYDNQNPFPEEGNRKLISQIADIHLCPTIQAKQNLYDEGIYKNVFVVGNTVIDNLLLYKDKCEYTNKILITLHRRENHHWIDKWFIEINKLAKKYNEYEFIIPIHPNPNVQKHKNLLKNVNVIEPLPYEDLLNLLVKTRLVITDSGGLQEECSFFNKKCLTCRKVTERPEAIGSSTFMVESPEKLIDIFELHHNDYEINFECPFGDGHSVNKIIKILNENC